MIGKAMVGGLQDGKRQIRLDYRLRWRKNGIVCQIFKGLYKRWGAARHFSMGCQ